MKVLWIVNDIIKELEPHINGIPTYGGAMIEPLLFPLSEYKNIEIAVVIPIIKCDYAKINLGNIIYYSIPIKHEDNIKPLNKNLIGLYSRAINDFQPEIIHIHGTERNFGLLRNHIPPQIPIIISIQGLVNTCIPYLYNTLDRIDLLRYKSLKNWLGWGGIGALKRKWKRFSKIELEIIAINKYFIGRTVWDKAQIKMLNNNAYYFHGEELLRDPFYKEEWSLNNCKKHSILISSGIYPLKGLHIVLEALSILKSKYPDILLYIPGIKQDTRLTISFKDFIKSEQYLIYIKSLVRKNSLEKNIIFLGNLKANQMSQYYSKCNLFIQSSSIENSSLALGEAMMVGTPTIVTPVGGITSIVKNDESALFFPSGDHRMLAYQIDKLFSNNDIAVKISQSAKKTAEKRHDIKLTVDQYVKIYTNTIQLHNENPSYFL
jgi:Glycosyltransferase